MKLLYCFTLLLMSSLSHRFKKVCMPVAKMKKDTPIQYFKNVYEAKFRDIKISYNPPVIDKKLSDIRDFFLNAPCGKMVVEPEDSIVNGTDAPDKAWPWQTLIHSNENICGGVLITDMWVLTAAHCFINLTRLTYNVELGIRITGPFWGQSDYTRVAKLVIAHEKWFDHFYDIALVKMDSRVRFSDWVRPACLPLHRNVFNNSDICYATGFGAGAPDDSGHTTLQQLRVFIVPLKECLYFWQEAEYMIDKRHLCVDAKDKAGICLGDSGGPVSCKYGGKYYVVGITNLVISTCFSDIEPDVFARVSEHLNWIFRVIDKYKF